MNPGSENIIIYIISYFHSCRLIAYWLLLIPPCVVSVCSVGVGEVFCSELLVWNLLGGSHESGYIYYLLSQSSPLVQCSTATTSTIQTRLCSIPLWTEDLWGALWHANLPLFFFHFRIGRDYLEPGTFSVRGRCSTNWAIPPLFTILDWFYHWL